MGASAALCRGFDGEQFKKVLQSWCLFTNISFDVLARLMEHVLELPVVQLSPEVKMTHVISRYRTATLASIPGNHADSGSVEVLWADWGMAANAY